MVGITLKQITKQFGSTLAVDAVDLHIRHGELFFLLGPSGCGKTTVMRMIAGLIEPSAGRVFFDDRDVTSVPTAGRNTALVFQSYALWPHMTVAQNVAFGLDVRRISAADKRRRVGAMLDMVRLRDLADRRPGQLSGGQQQRVALARALVVEPDVLLLDEPLSNLDAKLRHEMRSEIRRICDQTNVTAIYVTHDQEEALSIADRIGVMREGKVVQVGQPQELYTRPVSRFVADFLGRTNFLPATVNRREGETIVLDSPVGVLRSTVFADNLPTRGNVTCSVRPESIRLLESAAEARAGDNVLDVRHHQTTFLGHLAEHVVMAGPDVRIAMEELKPRPRQWPDAVHVAFGPEDLVVLAD